MEADNQPQDIFMFDDEVRMADGNKIIKLTKGETSMFLFNGRLPGHRNPEDQWERIVQQREALQSIPEEDQSKLRQQVNDPKDIAKMILITPYYDALLQERLAKEYDVAKQSVEMVTHN